MNIIIEVYNHYSVSKFSEKTIHKVNESRGSNV